MTCPECGADNDQVRETRARDTGVHRRRACLDCGASWWTLELHRAHVDLPAVRCYFHAHEKRPDATGSGANT